MRRGSLMEIQALLGIVIQMFPEAEFLVLKLNSNYFGPLFQGFRMTQILLKIISEYFED